MSANIEQLPIDNIPLQTEEKDVFRWLFPEKPQEETNLGQKEEFTSTRKYQFFINVGLLALLIFVAVFPKTQNVWIKVIPTNTESVLFSVMKVFIIFFLLYLVNYGISMKN